MPPPVSPVPTLGRGRSDRGAKTLRRHDRLPQENARWRRPELRFLKWIRCDNYRRERSARPPYPIPGKKDGPTPCPGFRQTHGPPRRHWRQQERPSHLCRPVLLSGSFGHETRARHRRKCSDRPAWRDRSDVAGTPKESPASWPLHSREQSHSAVQSQDDGSTPREAHAHH